MTKIISAAVVALSLLLPVNALASDATAHVTAFEDGTWQAIFKVELWSKAGITDTWRLVIDQQGCQVDSFDALPPLKEGGVVKVGVHLTTEDMPSSEPL